MKVRKAHFQAKLNNDDEIVDCKWVELRNASYLSWIVIYHFNLKCEAIRVGEVAIKYHKRDLAITWVRFIS